MADEQDIERILAADRYLVLATTGEDGRPWATPVFFAAAGRDRLCWVSSAESRHSRNIAARPAVAITVFDSGAAVGGAEAAYFEAEASAVEGEEAGDVLAALNARLPEPKRLEPGDLLPGGPLTAYVARVRRRYVLVRGGDPDYGNAVDMSVEV